MRPGVFQSGFIFIFNYGRRENLNGKNISQATQKNSGTNVFNWITRSDIVTLYFFTLGLSQYNFTILIILYTVNCVSCNENAMQKQHPYQNLGNRENVYAALEQMLPLPGKRTIGPYKSYELDTLRKLGKSGLTVTAAISNKVSSSIMKHYFVINSLHRSCKKMFRLRTVFPNA